MGRPSATYRLQVHGGFTFDDATAVLDYLVALGVSHVYLSPALQPAPGSVHGYDVVDHRHVNDEAGGEAAYARLVERTRQAGLGIVLDIVPNHMAVPTPESLNPVLWDVLQRGRASRYACWLDVDWDAHDGRLLMPVLGAPLDECLQRGEIVHDGPVVRYYDHVFPVASGTGHLPLPQLLGAQHFQLAYWRTGNTDLNYRRFFDVTPLAGVRVELPEVFDATHERVLRMVHDGSVDGLRVDHPDGLADPRGYLAHLAEASGGIWTVAEKILEVGEELPRDWPCAGTTGYDALAEVTGVLTDPAGEAPLTDAYAQMAGVTATYDEVVEQSKRLVVDRVLVAEVDRLADLLVRATEADRAAAREAVVEMLVAFGVYRAYVGDPHAAEHVAAARATAVRRAPHRATEIALVGRLALGEGSGDAAAEFATRFGQTTGPVMAKGVEDTTFYRYVRLAALNEVGNDPGRFALDVPGFHAYCQRLARDWPATMTTLSTHDTKRSEDVRARLLVLAELPAEWLAAVDGWRRRHTFGDANAEYLFWQSLVGAWPVSRERLQAYLEKATREAKRGTSWIDPDPDYDRARDRFVEEVFADRDLLDTVGAWVEDHLLVPGRVNSLSQKLVQLTMPGVPDVYQGCELWDLSLVDPDNRRPVDFAARRELLARLDPGGGPPPLHADRDGLSKLQVVRAALRARQAVPDTLTPGAPYEPLPAPPHLLAFARGGDAITVATRLPVGLERAGGWRDTTLDLPSGRWRDTITGRTWAGGTQRVGALLGTLPVALLLRTSSARMDEMDVGTVSG